MISEKEFLDIADDMYLHLPRYMKNTFEKEEIISEMFIICHKIWDRFNPKKSNNKLKFIYYRIYYHMLRVCDKEIKFRIQHRTNFNFTRMIKNSSFYSDYNILMRKISSKDLDYIIKFACEEISEKTLYKHTKLTPEAVAGVLSVLGSHY